MSRVADFEKEKADATLDFTDDDPAAVEVILAYIYTGIYITPKVSLLIPRDKWSWKEDMLEHEDQREWPRSLRCRTFPTLRLQVHVYLLAHKLDISELKTAALVRFRASFCSANIYHEDFPDLLNQIYESTDSHDELRLAATRCCADLSEMILLEPDAYEVIKRHEWTAFKIGTDLRNHIYDLEDRIPCRGRRTAQDKKKDTAR
jgi:hypothetical protein